MNPSKEPLTRWLGNIERKTEKSPKRKTKDVVMEDMKVVGVSEEDEGGR